MSSSWNESKNNTMLLRSIFLIVLFLYSTQFFTFSINENVMNAFIHGADLIFHEAWHVLFMPFWEFMSILWGSLFQCALPAILVGVFLKQEEVSVLGAQFALWWTGQNMTDVALYISDASSRSLPLIGGMSEEAHDWGNLLTMLDLLDYDHDIALTVHWIGLLLMIFAFFWGAQSILNEWRMWNISSQK